MFLNKVFPKVLDSNFLISACTSVLASFVSSFNFSKPDFNPLAKSEDFANPANSCYKEVI
jgi:hypothetical protein